MKCLSIASWRKGLLVATLSVGLVVGAAPSASAGTLDQQQTAFNGQNAVSDGGAPSSVAQTFTAGLSGKLDQVDLLLRALLPPNAPMIVEIRDASSAGPGVTVLTTGVIPVTSVGSTSAFVPVQFGSPPPVIAGVRYAIVAYSADSGLPWGWDVQTSDPYPGGASFVTADDPPTSSSTWNTFGSDQAFRTYVATPSQPATATATGQRAAALKKCKKLAKKHNWPHSRLKKCKRKAKLLPV